MKQVSIELCNSREEAEARKAIVKAGNPAANWKSRIIEKVDLVMSFLANDITQDPTPQMPPAYSPLTPSPKAPCAVLIIWAEDEDEDEDEE